MACPGGFAMFDVIWPALIIALFGGGLAYLAGCGRI